MQTIFDSIYWATCLAGAAALLASLHYFMKRRSTDSLAVRHHCELMTVLCFFMGVAIAFLVTVPYIFTITP